MQPLSRLRFPVKLLAFLNLALFLATAGLLGVFLLSSLNCSAPTEPSKPPTRLNRNDSLAVLAILKTNGLAWKDTGWGFYRDTAGRVVELHLDNLALDSIPPVIAELGGLRILNLAWNRIRSLPLEMEKITGLEALYVKGNQLKGLPDGIRFAGLETLDLSLNKLTSLPVNVDVTHLISLKLNSNAIRSLPPDFKYLSRLVTFEIGKNQLDSLPSDIGSHATLKYLDISENNLVTLPSSIMDLHPAYLNVGSNRLCYFKEVSPDSAAVKMMAWLDEFDRDWKTWQRCP